MPNKNPQTKITCIGIPYKVYNEFIRDKKYDFVFSRWITDQMIKDIQKRKMVVIE